MNRKFLRKKIVEILLAADITNVGTNVFANRSIPTNIDVLPVILVYSKNAPVEQRDEAPKSYIINQDIVIECITQHNDDDQLSDEMDDLSDAVIKIIEDNFFLEEECENVTLRSIINDVESDGQSPLGSTKVTYSFGLNFDPRQDIVLPDLKTLDNNWQINDNENNDAREQVTVQE